MEILESIQAIGKVPALNRILEIQQRIREIEKSFGEKVQSNDFQTVLENAMTRQTEKIKPIEEFLAENKLQPIKENQAADAAKTDSKKYFGGVNVPKENLRAENPLYESARRTENAAPLTTEQMILSAARKFGVDSELVKAVATAESDLNQAARSAVGAIGVMQLMPETAEGLGVNPYDEKQNIEGGAHYLRQMLDKFNGNLQNAIAAYNAGPGAVQKYGGVPPYSETQNYVGRVLDFYVR